MLKTLTSTRLLAGTALVLALATTAKAGPPLICHPFQTGPAALLPWAPDSGWNTPDPSYDIRRVATDTARLLTPDMPILARMENLRRATIYASRNREAAYELLTAFLGRALTAQAAGSRDPLPLFDAAYVIEAFRQAGAIHQWRSARERSEDYLSRELGDLRGYPFIQKAIALAGSNPELEFAASLMAERTAADEHRRRAHAGAPAGSLLAKNLAALN